MSVYTVGTIRELRSNLSDALNKALTGRVLIKRGDTTFELKVYTPGPLECTQEASNDTIRVHIEDST